MKCDHTGASLTHVSLTVANSSHVMRLELTQDMLLELEYPVAVSSLSTRLFTLR